MLHVSVCLLQKYVNCNGDIACSGKVAAKSSELQKMVRDHLPVVKSAPPAPPPPVAPM